MKWKNQRNLSRKLDRPSLNQIGFLTSFPSLMGSTAPCSRALGNLQLRLQLGQQVQVGAPLVRSVHVPHVLVQTLLCILFNAFTSM